MNEAYESPKPGTKATTKPRNPAAKQREASTTKKPAAKKAPAKKPAAKKPAQKKRNTYAPKVREATPVEEMLDAPKPASKPPTLSRYTPPVKKSLRNRIWGYFFGE